MDLDIQAVARLVDAAPALEGRHLAEQVRPDASGLEHAVGAPQYSSPWRHRGAPPRLFARLTARCRDGLELEGSS